MNLPTCLIFYLASRLPNLKFLWLSLVPLSWEIVLEIWNNSTRIKWSLRKMLYLSSSMPSSLKKQIKPRINSRKSNDFWGRLFIIMKKFWQTKDLFWINGKHGKEYSKKIKRTKLHLTSFYKKNNKQARWRQNKQRLKDGNVLFVAQK